MGFLTKNGIGGFWSPKRSLAKTLPKRHFLGPNCVVSVTVHANRSSGLVCKIILVQGKARKAMVNLAK